MKKKKLAEKKLSIKKMTVLELNQLSKIKGGFGENDGDHDPYTITKTSSECQEAPKPR